MGQPLYQPAPYNYFAANLRRQIFGLPFSYNPTTQTYTWCSTTSFSGYSLQQGVTPAVAVGDAFIYDRRTTPGNYLITVNGDGTIVINAGGDTSRQSFQWYLYRKSSGAVEGPATVYVNNILPVWIPVPQILFTQNVASVFSLAPYVSDFEGDTLILTLASGALFPGGAMSTAGIISGTPLALGTFSFIVQATDITGESTNSATIQIVVSAAASTPVVPGYMPDVVGLNITQATVEVYAATFTLTNNIYAFSSTVAAGLVISQSVVAGTALPFGTPVTLTVSLGAQVLPATTTVPNVVGLDEWVARAQCNRAQLILNTTQYGWHVSVPQAFVSAQSIPAGTIVSLWTPITLTVSDGYP